VFGSVHCDRNTIHRQIKQSKECLIHFAIAFQKQPTIVIVLPTYVAWPGQDSYSGPGKVSFHRGLIYCFSYVNRIVNNENDFFLLNITFWYNIGFVKYVFFGNVDYGDFFSFFCCRKKLINT
jgi:hypothetical protein